MERNAQLDDKNCFGRLSLVSLGIEFAHLVYEELQKKGRAFDGKRSRPSRAQPKYGKWDVNNRDFRQVINDMFQVDASKIQEVQARRLMLETHKGKDYGAPGNYHEG